MLVLSGKMTCTHFKVSHADIPSEQKIKNCRNKRLTIDLYPYLPPVKPDFRIIEINLIGLAYTAKLALHYFRRQPLGSFRDRCLIIKGSIASYADQPGSPQYNISKWGARGLMRNLRRTTWKEGIRVNLVAPWYGSKTNPTTCLIQ